MPAFSLVGKLSGKELWSSTTGSSSLVPRFSPATQPGNKTTQEGPRCCAKVMLTCAWDVADLSVVYVSFDLMTSVQIGRSEGWRHHSPGGEIHK